MNLKQYFDNRHDTVIGLAYKCGISVASVYNYLAEKRTPHHTIAQRIEKETGGRVTVVELRGFDERRK